MPGPITGCRASCKYPPWRRYDGSLDYLSLLHGSFKYVLFVVRDCAAASMDWIFVPSCVEPWVRGDGGHCVVPFPFLVSMASLLRGLS